MTEPITGYRTLSTEEVALINEIKAHAEVTRSLVHRVRMFCDALEDSHPKVTAPHRWANIAMTDLQTGYMALVRAVAAPTTF